MKKDRRPNRKLLPMKEIKQNLAENRWKSCLLDARDSGEKIVIHINRVGRLLGEVLDVYRFSFLFKRTILTKREVKPAEILKLKVRYAYPPVFKAYVSACHRVDKRIMNAFRHIPKKVEYRKNIQSARLQECLNAGTSLTIKTYAGDVFSGVLSWWGQYELGLDIGGGAVVTFFRHAIYGFLEKVVKPAGLPRDEKPTWLPRDETAVLEAVCDGGCRTVKEIAKHAGLGYGVARRIVVEASLLEDIKDLRAHEEFEKASRAFREGMSVQRLAEVCGVMPTRLSRIMDRIKARHAEGKMCDRQDFTGVLERHIQSLAREDLPFRAAEQYSRRVWARLNFGQAYLRAQDLLVLNAPECARKWGVSSQTVYNFIKAAGMEEVYRQLNKRTRGENLAGKLISARIEKEVAVLDRERQEALDLAQSLQEEIDALLG